MNRSKYLYTGDTQEQENKSHIIAGRHFEDPDAVLSSECPILGVW